MIKIMKRNQFSPENDAYTVILFYKYTTVKDTKACQDWQRDLCSKLSLTGRVRIATEGINATLEGKNEDITTYIQNLRACEFADFSDIEIKTSIGTGEAFNKLSVKVHPEIVVFGLKDDVNPNEITGVHLKPDELKKMYENNEDFVIIDMRNDYEYKVGHFKDSINPNIRNFREVDQVLPKILAEHPGIENKKVITVCTGGVRCEKASGYLLKKGFKDVYQLDGGMHVYMEKFPGKDFKGGLFTFDNRVVMDFTKDREIVGECDLCGVKTERFDNCINDECHVHMVVCPECRGNNEYIWCSDKCKLEGRLGKVRFSEMDVS
jgi:UPF0176 protein